MKKKKVSIVGTGIGGIATATVLNHLGRKFGLVDENEKIDVYQSSKKTIEKVGQGSTLQFSDYISSTIGFDFFDNKINATVKAGIMYEGWGKKTDKFFHPFPNGKHSFHYDPSLLSKAIFETKYFNLIEKDIDNFNEIDSDYVIDCRGKTYNDNDEDYYDIKNPLNAALISRKSGRDWSLYYTRTVATPHGWCFVIPNVDSVSYGYLYNSNITSLDEAKNNFYEMFGVEVDFTLNFKNYVAKNMWKDERVVINGNRYCFIEPLEATSIGIYNEVAVCFLSHIIDGDSKEKCNRFSLDHVKKVENFILWHYQNGSKYDTPFWNYAKSLTFKPDKIFTEFLEYSKNSSIEDIYRNLAFKFPEIDYAQWNAPSFKNWYDNVIE